MKKTIAALLVAGTLITGCSSTAGPTPVPSPTLYPTEVPTAPAPLPTKAASLCFHPPSDPTRWLCIDNSGTPTPGTGVAAR